MGLFSHVMDLFDHVTNMHTWCFYCQQVAVVSIVCDCIDCEQVVLLSTVSWSSHLLLMSAGCHTCY